MREMLVKSFNSINIIITMKKISKNKREEW